MSKTTKKPARPQRPDLDLRARIGELERMLAKTTAELLMLQGAAHRQHNDLVSLKATTANSFEGLARMDRVISLLLELHMEDSFGRSLLLALRQGGADLLRQMPVQASPVQDS